MGCPRLWCWRRYLDLEWEASLECLAGKIFFKTFANTEVLSLNQRICLLVKNVSGFAQRIFVIVEIYLMVKLKWISWLSQQLILLVLLEGFGSNNIKHWVLRKSNKSKIMYFLFIIKCIFRNKLKQSIKLSIIVMLTLSPLISHLIIYNSKNERFNALLQLKQGFQIRVSSTILSANN